MAVAWPAALAELLNQAEFGYQFGDTTVKSSVDVGPAKVRSRYTKGVDEVKGSIDMHRDQWEDLENFYKTSLGNGVLTFNYNHPVTTAEAEFRFKEPPSIVPLGGEYFRVSMSWELLP